MSSIFLDLTFEIIPVNYRPYKLMVLSGLPISKKTYYHYVCFNRILLVQK